MDHRQHKAPGNRWRCMADRKDLSFGSESSSHPLKDHKFFIHLTRLRIDEKEIEDTVERLGGKVDKFFNNEVTCVLTDDKTVTRPSIRASASWGTSHVDMCITDNDDKTKSLAEATASKSCDTKREGIPTVNDTESGLDIKGEKLPGSAVNRLGRLKGSAGTCKEPHNSIVSKAKMLGIRVCHIKDFILWTKAQNGVKRVQNANSASKSKKPHLVLGRKRMVHKLCGPIIKVEDAQSMYKPFYKELKKDPALLLEPYHTGSPYDDLEAIHAYLPVKKHRDNKTKVKPTPEISKGTKQPHVQPKNQYCECCREFFCDLPKHLNSDKHRDFVNQQHNFECLKEFVDCFPNNVPPVLTALKVELNSTKAGLPESPPTDSPQSESAVIKQEPLEHVKETKISLDAHKLICTSKSVVGESPLQLKLPLCAPLNANVFPTPSPSSSPLQCVNALSRKEDTAIPVANEIPTHSQKKWQKNDATSGAPEGIHLPSSCTPNAFIQSVDTTFLSLPNNMFVNEASLAKPHESNTQAAPVVSTFLSSPIPIDDLPSPPSDTPVLLEWPDFIETPCETKVAHSLSSSSFVPGNGTLSQGLPSISHFGQEQELFKCSAENMFSSDSSDNNFTGDIQNILDGVLFNLNDLQNKPAREECDVGKKVGYSNLGIAQPQETQCHATKFAINNQSESCIVYGNREQNGGLHVVPHTMDKNLQSCSSEIGEKLNKKDVLFKDTEKIYVEAVSEVSSFVKTVDRDIASLTNGMPKSPIPLNCSEAKNVLTDNIISKRNSFEDENIVYAAPQQTTVQETGQINPIYTNFSESFNENGQSRSLQSNINASPLLPSANEEALSVNNECWDKFSEGNYREPPCLHKIEPQIPVEEPDLQDQNGYNYINFAENNAEPPHLEQVSLHDPCNNGEWSKEELKRWNDQNNEPPVLQKVTQWSPVSENNTNAEDIPIDTEGGIRDNADRESFVTDFDACSGIKSEDAQQAGPLVSPQISAQTNVSHREENATFPDRTVGNASAESARGISREAGQDRSSANSSPACFQWRVHQVQGIKLIIRRSLVKDKL